MKFITVQKSSGLNLIRILATSEEEKCETLEVIIPDEIQVIEQLAFKDIYRNVAKVKLPNYLLAIQKYAFDGCKKLQVIEIPDSVTEIGVRAFENCESLQYVKLPNKLEKLNLNTFSQCYMLKALDIPLGTKLNYFSTSWERDYNCEFKISVKVPVSKEVIVPTDIYFSKEYNISQNGINKLSDFFHRFTFRNFKNLNNNAVKFSLAVALLKYKPWAEEYVRTNIQKIGKYLVYNNDTASLLKMLEFLNFKGTITVNKLIEYAIQLEHKEAAISLMQYKQKIGGYEKENNSKSANRFEL